MLSPADTATIKQLIHEKVEPLAETVKKLQEAINHLPTKDEFYSKMDEVRGELKAIREEQTLQNGRQSQHTDDIEDHEARISCLEKQDGLPPLPTPGH
jgi:predicted nuclease with TOPRIM domain